MRGDSNRILVFIPAYNCGRQISRVLAQFGESYQRAIDEILVVENRGTDNTLQRAAETLKKITHCKAKLVQNDENYSLGGSHKVAFNYAIENNYNYVVVLHGDDQGTIADLMPYIESREALSYDSFLGSRFGNGSKCPGYSKFRILGNIIYNTLISIAVRTRITDMGSGLNLYCTNYLRSKFYSGFPDDLTFNVYMLLHGIYSKSNFRFFPLTWREDDQVSNARLLKQAFHIAKMVAVYLLNPRWLFEKKQNEPCKEYTFKTVYSSA